MALVEQTYDSMSSFASGGVSSSSGFSTGDTAVAVVGAFAVVDWDLLVDVPCLRLLEASLHLRRAPHSCT